MPLRTAARKDANHSEIVSACRQIGAYVLDISQLPNCADLLVGYRGRWIVLEVKDGEKTKSQTKLTKGEQKFHDQAGYRAPVHIVYSADEAINILTGKKI